MADKQEPDANTVERATAKGIPEVPPQAAEKKFTSTSEAAKPKTKQKDVTALESIRIEPDGKVMILNQLLIPLRSEYEQIESIEDGWAAIRLMKVRGAPAIAMVGSLSLAVELDNPDNKFKSVGELRKFIVNKFEYLETARETACNLSNAKKSILAFLDAACASKQGTPEVEDVKKRVIQEIKDMLKADRKSNEAIGKNGADRIIALHPDDKEKQFTLLTHCNTGSLATAGYGTALGIVRRLHEMKRLKLVYCTETRPYNQGSRLTAYELVNEAIPGTLIADSMAAAAMKEKSVDAVVVGADRIARNGDVANKIGTLQLAIVAKHFNVPFYVAANTTTVDLTTEAGKDIAIEERADIELVTVSGIRIAAPGIATWNPAFDVTPAELITGIVTEVGVIEPKDIATTCVAKEDS